MKRIQHLIAVVWLALVAQASFAEGGVTLFLQLKDGTQEKYSLLEKPVVTFDSENVLIKTRNAEVAVPFSFAQVEKFFFDVVEEPIITPDPQPEPQPDAIGDLEDEQGHKTVLDFAYDGRTARIRGLAPDANVAVYALGGQRVQPSTTITSNSITIAMGELPAGIYIIRAGNRSFKIIRK